MDARDVVALFAGEVALQQQVHEPMTAFIGVRISWLMLARKVAFVSGSRFGGVLWRRSARLRPVCVR